jgi:hypothetical protein
MAKMKAMATKTIQEPDQGGSLPEVLVQAKGEMRMGRQAEGNLSWMKWMICWKRPSYWSLCSELGV